MTWCAKPFRRLIALLVLLGNAAARGEETAEAVTGSMWTPTVSAAIGYHYSVGDYDLSRDTEVMYVPFMARAEVASVALQMTVPYIYIRGPEGIFGIVAGSSESEDIHADSGLGDILLEATYRIAPRFRAMPYVDLNAGVKFPSASEHDGLGTGAYDFALGLDAYWVFGRTIVLISGGRRFLGDADEFALRDVFTVSAGAVYSLFDWLDTGALADFQEKTSRHSDVSADIVPYLRWRFWPRFSADLYGSFGLADGSPDYATGLQVSYQVW